jgi:hypothetical protein
MFIRAYSTQPFSQVLRGAAEQMKASPASGQKSFLNSVTNCATFMLADRALAI